MTSPEFLPAAKPPRASFWQETKAVLPGILKVEWPWLFSFAMLAAAVVFYITHSGIPAAAQTDPNFIKQHPELLSHIALGGLLQLMLYMISFYVFGILCLNRMVDRTLSFSSSGFFYWLWKCIQKYMALLAPMISVGSVAGAIIAAQKHLALSKAVAVVAIIFMLLAFCYNYYAIFRLYLVSPLALLRRDPVLKNSWNMTKGECWRIFVGMLILFIVLAAIFIIPYIIIALLSVIIGKGSVVSMLALALLQGIWQSVMIMSSVVYVCTVYRVLLRENKQNSLSSSST